jgi:hypothetical protein
MDSDDDEGLSEERDRPCDVRNAAQRQRMRNGAASLAA